MNQLNKKRDELAMSRPCTICTLAGWDAMSAEHERIVKGLLTTLEKIADYSTAGDGNKYPSYEHAWHGVAEFAKKELEAYKRECGE